MKHCSRTNFPFGILCLLGAPFHRIKRVGARKRTKSDNRFLISNVDSKNKSNYNSKNFSMSSNFCFRFGKGKINQASFACLQIQFSAEWNGNKLIGGIEQRENIESRSAIEKFFQSEFSFLAFFN